MRVTCLLLIALLHGVYAQGAPPLEKGPELEGFMDGAIATLMETEKVPGVVCSVVKENDTIFIKGYGVSNTAERKPVDPAASLFEVASVSKLFTATAVMQQVERGTLDLDADVNGYIKGFQIPPIYEQAITLRHLLTHTAGFTENSIGMGQREPVRAEQSLGDFLARHLPPRVRPPGVVWSYSNYGISLTGYIVECVTGQDFAEYVREHILQPLGMEHSSFRRDEAISNALAKPYQYRGGLFLEKINNYTIDYPAGAMATTAQDMTRFMLAHLNGGAWNGVQILQQTTVDLMHTQQFTHDPRLPGMGIVFFEEQPNGRRAIMHDGYLRGFASLCYLIPEERVGVFLSNNGDSTRMWRILIDRFTDHYFPAPEPSTAPAIDGFDERVAPFLGTYRPTRHAAHSIEKLAMFIEQVTVTAPSEGLIKIAGARVRHFREREPLLFADEESDTMMAMVAPKEGQPRALVALGAIPLEKLAWWETFPVQAGYLAAILVVLMSSIVVGPWLRLKEHLYPSPRVTMRARWAGAIAWVMSVTFVLFLVALIVTLTTSDTYEFIYGVPADVKMQVAIGHVAAALAVMSLVLLPDIWRKRLYTPGLRAYHTLVVLCGLALLPFMWYWNLIGFNW